MNHSNTPSSSLSASITVERRRWIVSRTDVLSAGFVNAGQTLSGMRWIFRWNVIVRIDVVTVQIKRELKILGYAVLKLLAKIDDLLVAVLFLPAGSYPLLKFDFTFRCKLGGVGPCENVCVRPFDRKTKQKRNRKS